MATDRPTPTARVHAPRAGVRNARALAATLLLGLLACGADSIAGPVGLLTDGRAGRWSTASPSSLGLDASVLEAMEERIDAGEFGAISSVLILRSGILTYERYWGALDPAELHPVYSVTKSVTSLLVGIATGDDDVPDLQTPILDVLPAFAPVRDAEAKEAITLEHVLQMRAGLDWDELSTNYTDAANPIATLVGSADWTRFVLDLPLGAEPPGAEFVYNSGLSLLLAEVLRTYVGRSTQQFADERLFGPLGITVWTWEQGPLGLTNSGWGLHLRPRDMAAIGQLTLERGRWEGQQIVPSEWIVVSGAPATRFTDGTGYGYQWWLDEDDGSGRPMAAWGWGGQYIVVIPSLDMVIVSTADNYDGGGITPYALAQFGYDAVVMGAVSPTR